MNLSIAVIGTSKAGKTLFCINFAEYMGAGNLSYAEYTPGGQGRGLLSPAGARRLMVGRSGRGNGVLRIFTVHLPPRPYAASLSSTPSPCRQKTRCRAADVPSFC